MVQEMKKTKPVLITDPKELAKQPEVKKILKGLKSVKESADLMIKLVDNKKVIVINDIANQTEIINMRGRIKKGQKMINENKDFFVKPLNIILKSIRDYYKNLSVPLDEYDTIMADALRVFKVKLDEERLKKEAELQKQIEAENKKKAEKEAKLQAKLDAEKDEKAKAKIQEKLEETQASETDLPVDSTIENSNITKTEETKMHWKDHWTGDITDKAMALKYLIDNNKLEGVEIKQSTINELSKDHKGALEIPGFKLYNKPSPAQ